MKLDSVIKEGKIIIFSLSYCPFCNKAKKDLISRNIPFQSFEFDKGELDDNFKKELQTKTNHFTFPNIFFGLQFIGGYDSLSQLMKSPDQFQNVLKNNKIILE